MALRLLGCLLLLVLVGAFSFPTIAPTQESNLPPHELKWEYKVLSLDSHACSLDGGVVSALNALGHEGWELVSYERATLAFPKEADGRLTIAPAATGPSRDVNPPTADSFQGTISMRMGQTAPGECRMLLKREWQPAQE